MKIMPFMNKFYIGIHRIVTMGPIGDNATIFYQIESNYKHYGNWLHMW
jgi:hypothetical protein